jgi:hypothetical protein
MKLVKIRNNFHVFKAKGYSIYFSYETPIALLFESEMFALDKYFSKTTNKHLNVLKSDYLIQYVPEETFKHLIEKVKL